MTIEHAVDRAAIELLQLARTAAWGDEADAVAAYDYALGAITQAFRQIATPDNPTTDLGAILSHYAERPDLWNARYLRLSELEPIMAMIEQLWRGRPQPEERSALWPDEARIAVVIAESVVKLLEQGFVELLDELTPEEEAEDLRVAEENLVWYEAHGADDSIPFEEMDKRLEARWREKAKTRPLVEYVAERAARERGERDA